uniref:Retrotransposon gag domain-containing protein n=1 Tax=Tanacetum cinerariifolium TaxID=118510 RepID=A0A6L2KDR4_TANCI|nr:hypothetical protein [Tanacetum cinerariifolium]
MRTRSSSNLPVESPVDTMADQRTMAELLCAPTEGYAKAIVVPPILAEQFELKHSLINMMTSDQFFGLENDNPHDHIRWEARRWLEKEPSHSTFTWEDLVLKFINEFIPPSRTTNLRNEIPNFQQQFDESFHEAWDRYKDLLRACPHHGFTELHQLDAFYNALNLTDQDSLNSVASGNLLEIRTQDVLTIIENKSKIAKLAHAVNQQTSAVTTTMTAILKQFYATTPLASVKSVEEIYVTCGGAHPYYQCLAAGGNTFLELRDNIQGYVAAATVNYNQAILKQFHATPPLASVKSVEEIYVTCGGAHPYYQCLAAGGNTFLELRDNIQGYVAAATVNYNQGNSGYRPPSVANQILPSVSGHLLSNTIANPKGELKAITTRSGIVLDGPSDPIPPLFINSEEDERVEETLTDQDLAEYTIKLHINITLVDALILILKYQKMLKALLSNKDKLLEQANTPLNENCLAVILKKLPKKLGDPVKFLIPCGFSELKCKALANLANRAICTPAGIARDVFVPVGKFTFPDDFVIVDYESDPRVPLILGRHFLRIARTLNDVHGEEMILRDGDERLTLNMRHDTSSYSNQPKKVSINMINVFNDSSEDFLENLFATNHQSGNPTFSSHLNLTLPEGKDDIFDPAGGSVLIKKLLDLDSTTDLHPPHRVNPLRNDDLLFDIEFDLKEMEYLLHHDPIKDIDSIVKDSIDQSNLADLNDNLVDTISEMFTDEHALDYSSPLIYDEYDDDLFEVESDTEYLYNDPFDSKGEKIKEFKLLIDEIAILSDFLLSFEYDTFLFEDFSKVDALPSTNNEDKVFNPGILIQENLFEVITHVAQDKNEKS